MQTRRPDRPVWLTRVLVLVMLGLLVWPAAAQDGEGPVRLSEVRQMLRQGLEHDEVVRAVAERGMGFEMSRSTMRRLDQWGFSETHMEQFGMIMAGEDPFAEPAPGEEGEGAGGGEGEAGGDAEEQEFAVGYRDDDGTHDAEKARIERAIAGANLAYERVELSRVTLYCERRRARALGELLQRTERALIARFPESIVNAIEPRSAHIIVVDGESQWNRWLEGFQASYAQDGITFPEGPEGDFKSRMADSPGYTTGNTAAIRADRAESQQQLNRQVTYHLGHLMMHGASRPEGYFENHPVDALVTGFGNLVETMAMGDPSVMVVSYVDRDLDNDGSWARMVQKRFEDGQITGVTNVWTFSTDSMTPGHYAEAWSMVSLLSEVDPAKFADAVLAVQREEASMAEAVRAAYELEDAQLLQGWHRYAN